MREHKFRGKTKSHFGDGQGNVVIPKNTWIYGGITYDEDRVWIDTKYYGQIIVDKETVGQFTGLHDKNGQEIYEGDIVELKAENGCCNMLGKIIYDNYDLAFELIDEEGNQEALWYAEQELEVIGNIYENPELLEE